MSAGIYLVCIALIAGLWGISERAWRLVRRGVFSRSLGRRRTSIFVQAVQGTIALALFGMMVAAFFTYGWKTGVGSVLMGFGVGALTQGGGRAAT